MNLLNGIVNPLAHIVCRDSNRLIGMDDRLPWKCTEDLKYFQTVNKHKVLIVGYNTYKSLRIEYNNGGYSLEDPVLKDRVTIVIADSKRFDHPTQNLNYSGISRLIQAYTLDTDDSKKLLGFTVFVECLEQAIKVADIISTCLKSAMSQNNEYGNWHRDIGSPVAYVIGGSKLYKETLERAYVSEIYETVLPIGCNLPEGSTPYYYPEVDASMYRSSNLMRQKCKVLREGSIPINCYMEVIRHKRKVSLDIL